MEQVKITVFPGGWGKSRGEDVTAVLNSVAMHFLPYFPTLQQGSIQVVPIEENAMILFEKSPTGATIIQLSAIHSARERFTFQFAHELCHYTCHFERRRGSTNQNAWFEESLCEAASLFVLRAMAATWSHSPPYPHWQPYATRLGKYAENIRFRRKLPYRSRFLCWYKEREEALRHDRYMRQANRVVGVQILPLLDRNPQNWGAIEYLNPTSSGGSESFESYLSGWHERCPSPHKGFVEQVAQLFEIEIEQSCAPPVA